VSFRWTETLKPSLAARTRQGSWDRIEKAREGGWLLLSGKGDGDGVHWYRMPDEDSEPVLLNPLEDARLPAVTEAMARWLRRDHRVQLLAWRVGSRAIFRIRGRNKEWISKLYRRDRQLPERWTVLTSAAGAGWRVPRVLDWDPALRMLSFSFCRGRSLNHGWVRGEGMPSDGDRVAQLLEWLSTTRPPPGFPTHGAEDETRLLGERLETFEQVLDHPPSLARDLMGAVSEALRNDPPKPPSLCHRDFHDKQVLIDGSSGSLIDLDLAAAGPPALDPGNILAHLRLRALKGAKLPWREIAERIAGPCVRTRGVQNSIHRWTAASLLRLALIYARRRRPADLIDNLLSSTEQALGRTGEWRGIL